MKKMYPLRDLDCANCAATLEAALEKVDGVLDVGVNFMSQKLTLEAADDRFDEVFAQVKKTIAKIEPDVVVTD